TIFSSSAKSRMYASWKPKRWCATSSRARAQMARPFLVPVLREGIKAHECDCISHRLDIMYRLQGMRGGVQGMERCSRGWIDLDRLLLRQHSEGGCLNMETREVRRERSRAGFRR